MTVVTIIYASLFVVSVPFIYNRLTKNIISRLNANEAPKSKFDIVKVDKDNLGSLSRAGGIDVVFVHGLGSNPDTTWTVQDPSGSSKDTVCWVTDFLPEDIPPHKCDNVRLYFYNYDSFWKRDAVQTQLFDLGNDMLQKLRQIRGNQNEYGRYLVLVGHSYGGLVIKQALIHANQNPEYTDIVTHVKAIFFLGTPHRGSDFSFGGKTLARLLQPLNSNPAILEELEYDSLYLHELQKRFTQAAGNVPSIINFYERRKTRVLKVWCFQWDEFCVRKQSATYSGNPNQVKDVGLDVDHYGLNKFGSKNESYNRILYNLLDIIDPAITESQQRIYSVSIKPVRSYTRRESSSREIENKLQQTSPNRSRPYAAAICGPGGTGKTQLALNYVEKHKDKFNPILWIDAESQETALAGFVRCAYLLGIPVNHTLEQDSHTEKMIIVQTVCQWLQSRKKSDDEWLVVFDNVDSMAWNVFDVFPEGQQGNIIMISQNEQSSKLLKDCEKVSVDLMTPLEATSLLSWHLELDCHPQRQELEDLCDEVADCLGYLPVAVDLAGVYMGNEADPRSALNYYKKHQNRLLRSNQYNRLSGYDKTVWTVWDSTLRKIEERYSDRRSKLLLIFLAHFPSGLVQEELFRLASLGLVSIQQTTFANDFPEWLKSLLAIDGEEWDDFHYRHTCAPLVIYGLLKPVRGKLPGIKMHTLVQWRALQYKEDYDQAAWDKWYMQFIRLACHGLWEQTARLQLRRRIPHDIPHATASLEPMDKVNGSEMLDTFSETRKESQWIETEAPHQAAPDVRKMLLEPQDPDKFVTWFNNYITGIYTEVEPLVQQTLTEKEMALFPDRSDILTRIWILSACYHGQRSQKKEGSLY